MRVFFRYIAVIVAVATLALSCRKSDVMGELHQIELFTEIQAFENEAGTKVSDDGEHFVDGDWIRVKIICPYSSDTQIGESTYGNSVDDFYLLKRKSGAWTHLESSDCCDIDANYYYRDAPSLPGIYEAQPTPYVYTSSTWSEEKVFKTKDGIANQFCHVFHADQSLQKNYRASDLLWAQQYMQTGSWNVHLSFRHVLSCIRFKIDDSDMPADKKISGNAVLTLESMPDIDRQEILVGDYYAAKSKREPKFGYKKQVICEYADNGKVLGISVNDYENDRSYCRPFSGIANTAVYTAYKSAVKTYSLIVPPVDLGSEKAVVWLRDGSFRYTKTLDLTHFEQGKLYDVTIKLTPDE